MTTRAAALAGLQYFSDVRAIAAQVGVAVPGDAAIAARFAATDSIDLTALADDAVMLDDVIVTLGGAVDSAHDVRRGLATVWHGAAAEAADAAVGTHLRTASDVVDGVRTVSATVTAAATALGRVQGSKHRTLAMLQADNVAGQPMSTISAEDVAADPEPYRADIVGAVELFTRTMDVVDAAAAAILATLTDSFRALPAPHEIGPRASLRPGQRSGPRRDPRARRRTDIVVTPTAGGGRGRGGPDPDVVVAAISAGATIAGAAIAAASSVGTAATGGVGAVLTHLINAGSDLGDGPDGDDRAIVPIVPGRTEPEASVGEGSSRATDPIAPTAVVPVPVAPQPLLGVEPSSPTVRGFESETVPEVPAAVLSPDTDDRSPSTYTADPPSPGTAEAWGVPSVGPRQRDREQSRGRPDPDDGGGLALAGDR
ncbi:hypothetical protein [Williamsia maris]|uniref:Uncharacterized protein n=1 Tax=Williamsia maris TaxID=72806 RepID=A0ABT1H9S4_9NOCA|nr:hypothetical protein [Williamsia maris]MCP2174408.1 hypothetical protein [Williamsia maris]